MYQSKNHMPDLVRRVFLSWLSAAALEYFLLPGRLRTLKSLDSLAHMSLPRVFILTFAGTFVLSFLAHFVDSAKAERLSMAPIFLVLSAASLHAAFSWPLFFACCLILLLLIIYGIYGWNKLDEETEILPAAALGNRRRLCLLVTVTASLLFVFFVCAWTVGRIYSFSAPTYDFGIFSQMFYYMKKSALPMTTLERDGMLSHFSVHVSPIYYLLLPIYLLFPTPATLQVLQAAVLASSVIPLWKLGKHHGVTGLQQMSLCLLLLLYPAFSGGTAYDLHENCFLAPLLFWLFYGIARQSAPITALAALLTLMVKEDAAVYTAVTALWLTVKAILKYKERSRRDLLTGVLLLAASLIWFFFTTNYLAASGDGVMTYRYGNFLYGGSSSLLTVVGAVCLHPMKTIYECVDQEKLPFMALTLVPLLGLPLFTRRYERYLLLIPYVLVNLMSDYPYQHSIFFQYTFGSTACLLYLSLLNLADWNAAQTAKSKHGRKHSFRLPWPSLAAVTAAAACAFASGMAVLPKAVPYPAQCIQNRDHYRQIRQTLSRIPEDASVAASSFYTVFLSQRDVLYDIKYSSTEHLLGTDYIVFDPLAENDFQNYAAVDGDNGHEAFVKLLEEHGYRRSVKEKDIEIWAASSAFRLPD